MSEHVGTEHINALCTVDRIENGVAVLSTESKEEVIVPQRLLPAGAHEGDVFMIRLQKKEEEGLQKEQAAKNILNELFGQSSR